MKPAFAYHAIKSSMPNLLAIAVTAIILSGYGTLSDLPDRQRGDNRKAVLSDTSARQATPYQPEAESQGYIPSEANLAAREAFADARFGIFIHWGIYSMLGHGEWVMQNENIDYRKYPLLARGFNPSGFDASEWVRAIKASGAKYLTITSRHHDGFSMYDSKASGYNIVKATPFGRDVLKELSQACAEEGITLNFYYSHLDWGRTDYWPPGRTGLGTGRPEGNPDGTIPLDILNDYARTASDIADENARQAHVLNRGQDTGQGHDGSQKEDAGQKPDGSPALTDAWKHYMDFIDAQLTELLTGYGPIGAIWFDGVWDKDASPREDQPEIWNLSRQYELIHRLQPACLVGNNHHLLPFEGEDIQIFERDIPGMNEYGLSGQEISRLPLETCQTMNRSWGYRITDKDYKSADFLIRYLVRTAGKGANLLLNIGPRPDGTLPEEAVERLEAIGKWLETNGETIYGTEGGCIPEQPWGVTTQKGNDLYVHILEGNMAFPADGCGTSDSGKYCSPDNGKSVSTRDILLPLPAQNILAAETFADGKEIPFVHTPEGVVLKVPSFQKDTVDCIIKVRLEKLTAEEEDYLAFMYRSMPLPDLTGYPFGYWLANVRKAMEIRSKSAWEIPEREFRHFVLPVRVNNEAVDDFRTTYADELGNRIKGMNAEQAALEVNHWCHEMATYTPSDARTLPPTGTIKAGLGRCGEESVLAVAALRAAGIPARQVYTPRWAHTDDNHAWVEVYVDGNWHFMGACEPEPVLDLAWFNAPVSRAMLLHTLAFGDYDGPEDVIRKTRSFTEINVIKSYIPTRRTCVMVLDESGKPVDGAKVEFKIYNYAEFYTVARQVTGADGTAGLDTGIGDMLVWAYKDGAFGIAKASGEMTEITLDRRIGERFGLDFDIVPPAENPIPSKATPWQVKLNTMLLAREDSIRNARPKGNDKVIAAFRKAHKGKNAEALLASLSAKDMGDVRADVLADAIAHCGNRFSTWRDCPRVSYEPLLPYFKEIGDGLEADSAQEIFEWTLANIRIDDTANPQGIRIPPINIWKSRISDTRSREIFFVAACRSKGIEARIDEITGKTQYRDGKIWKDVKWSEDTPEAAGHGTVSATYAPVSWLRNPLYYRHFTLSRIEDGPANLMAFDENMEAGWREILAAPYTADEGYYLLTSGIRMADGSVSAHLEFFNVDKDRHTDVPLVLRHDADGIAVIGNIDAEQKYLPQGMSDEASILSVTGRGYFAMAIIKDFAEPSIHALRQLGASSGLLNEWGRKLIVLCSDEEGCNRCKGYLGEISGISYGTDPDGKVLKMIYDGSKPESASLPVIIVADSFGRVVYYSQGYNTSLSEQLRHCLTSLD